MSSEADDRYKRVTLRYSVAVAAILARFGAVVAAAAAGIGDRYGHCAALWCVLYRNNLRCIIMMRSADDARSVSLRHQHYQMTSELGC